jgi:hypothetical protein
MSFLNDILKDLRAKRLWPVVAALIAGIVAVPVLLSSSSNPAPVASLPQPIPTGPPATALPAISVSATPTNARLPGRGRDPFTQQKHAKAASSSTGSTTSGGTGGGGTGATTTTSTATTPTATTPTATTPTTTTSTTTTTGPTVTPEPAPARLTADQSYHVSLSITNGSGGVQSVDPLERLSILPSEQRPMLVELGVLAGGRRVLFAVQPGTMLRGPGRCTPGPIDCEILSLAQNQTEGLWKHSSAGVVSVAQFAVTAISAQPHASAAAADKARRTESAAGRHLLSASTLNALSLFRYEPSLGAVVDLRNLTVGGN